MSIVVLILYNCLVYPPPPSRAQPIWSLPPTRANAVFVAPPPPPSSLAQMNIRTSRFGFSAPHPPPHVWVPRVIWIHAEPPCILAGLWMRWENCVVGAGCLVTQQDEGVPPPRFSAHIATPAVDVGRSRQETHRPQARDDRFPVAAASSRRGAWLSSGGGYFFRYFT
jgi:hypothetical protein